MKHALMAAVALALFTAALFTTGFAATLGLGSQKVTPGSRTIVRASCTTLAAAADAFVQEDMLTTVANTTLLEVKSDTPKRYTLIRFDLASCNLPAGANVESATLALMLVIAPLSPRTYSLHRLASSWSETTVTWANQPAAAATATASGAIPIVAGRISIDVTSDVNRFATGAAANHGWRISDADVSSTALGQFASSSHLTASWRPQLSVSYAH